MTFLIKEHIYYIYWQQKTYVIDNYAAHLQTGQCGPLVAMAVWRQPQQKMWPQVLRDGFSLTERQRGHWGELGDTGARDQRESKGIKASALYLRNGLTMKQNKHCSKKTNITA